jgi:hypothetical protein
LENNANIVIDSDNKVGIGTATPTAKLHIDGNVRVNTTSFASDALIEFGDSSTPNYSWVGRLANDGDLSLRVVYAGYHMKFFTTNTERMRIDNTGNVGIGTNIPNQLLEVKGNSTTFAKISSATATAFRGVGFGIENDSNIYGSLAFETQNGELRQTAGFSTFGGFQTFYTNGSERMRIASGGNVGVGTPSPDNLLHISNSASFTRMMVENTNNGPGGAGIYMLTKNAGTIVSNATLRTTNDGTFSIFTGTTTEPERLTIIATGNVGIGLTSPQQKLSIDGGIGIGASSKIGAGNFYSGNTAGGGFASFADLELYSGSTGNTTLNNQGYAINLQTASVSRLFITQGGNLGIGNTNPLSLLHIGSGTTGVATPTALELDRSFRSSVGGNMSLKFYLYRDIANNESYGIGLNSQAGVEYHAGSNSGATTGTTNHSFYINNTERMKISANGDVTNSTGVYGTISDIRVKENIVQSKNYIEDLMKLRVVKYSLKEEKSTKPTKLGFIAQEVEKVFPNMVTTSKEGDIEDFKSIKTSVLIPMLVKAIQELKTELDELKAKVG